VARGAATFLARHHRTLVSVVLGSEGLSADDDSYLPSQPDLCATFHQKIFAQPIPPSYLPPPVRPTRPSIPSRDEVSRASSASVRSISRAPSEVSESRAPSTSANTLHRSVSRTSDTLGPQEMRRSRSRSIDPLQARPAEVPKRPMIRAPSGKDLFKGREVGLMRRTGSMKRQDSLGIGRREESQLQPSGLGLLGRKTSDPKKRRVSNDGTFLLIVDLQSTDSCRLPEPTKRDHHIRYSRQTSAWEPILTQTISPNSNPRRTIKWRTFQVYFYRGNTFD